MTRTVEQASDDLKKRSVPTYMTEFVACGQGNCEYIRLLRMSLKTLSCSDLDWWHVL